MHLFITYSARSVVGITSINIHIHIHTMWLMSLAKILWHFWESGLNAPEMVWYSEHQLCSSTLYKRAEELSIAHTTQTYCLLPSTSNSNPSYTQLLQGLPNVIYTHSILLCLQFLVKPQTKTSDMHLTWHLFDQQMQRIRDLVPVQSCETILLRKYCQRSISV